MSFAILGIRFGCWLWLEYFRALILILCMRSFNKSQTNLLFMDKFCKFYSWFGEPHCTATSFWSRPIECRSAFWISTNSFRIERKIVAKRVRYEAKGMAQYENTINKYKWIAIKLANDRETSSISMMLIAQARTKSFVWTENQWIQKYWKAIVTFMLKILINPIQNCILVVHGEWIPFKNRCVGSMFVNVSVLCLLCCNLLLFVLRSI